MRKIFVAFGLLLFISSCGEDKTVEATESKEVKKIQTENTEVYNKVDPSSELHWRASHLGGVGKRFGNFSLRSAEVLVNDGKITNARFVVDMNSITVENFKDDLKKKNKLTNHLKSADFFDVARHPTSIFEITGIEPVDEGDFNSKITGNLKIKDISKSISFKADVEVTEDYVRIRSEDFSVNRQDWGINYNSEGTPGIPRDFLIDDEVGFRVDVKINK